MDTPPIGVLALQGGFEAHEKMFAAVGAATREVRVAADLDGVGALVIPGGESTTITLGIEREKLAQPIRDLAARGAPILGTCAGLIMLDSAHLGLMDITARRTAFGRQLHSFEEDLDLPFIGPAPLRAIFIRAPWIEHAGPQVEVLAAVDSHPVAARQGEIFAVSFHAELGTDTRLHAAFAARVAP